MPELWEPSGAAPPERERPGRQAEAGCSYTTWVTSHCRVEEQAGGRPVKLCERLLRRYRDCGRGKELEEELLDHNYRPGAASSLDGFLRDGAGGAQMPPSQPLRSGPLDADVGEALQEFMQYADQIKQRAAGVPEPKGGVALDETYARRQLPAEPPPQMHEPWYARLFHRRAQCSPGRQRPWKQFEDDFQEV